MFRSTLTTFSKPLKTRLTRQITTTSALLKPTDPSSSSSSSRPTPSQSQQQQQQARSSSAAELENIIQNMGELQAAQDDTNSDSLFRSLPLQSVTSPRSLSPQNLLNPYPSKPNLSSAYPLGPPANLSRVLDRFQRLNISPLDSPMNPYFGSEFCTSMGKIMGRGKTGLGRKNQRRVGKAVRRGRSMGVLSTFGQSLPGNGGGGYY